MLESVLPRSWAQRAYRGIHDAYGYFYARLTLLQGVLYDYRRYAHWSFALRRPMTQQQLRAHTTMRYHSIEKGLALSEPRPGFGSQKIRDLQASLVVYARLFGADEHFALCLNVLDSYARFNRGQGVDVTYVEDFLKESRQTAAGSGHVYGGGVLQVTKEKIQDAALVDFEKFAWSRHSVRNFTNEEVPLDLIEKAVLIARKTPSVCNRQSWRVHVFSDSADKRDVLYFQNGNSGFGHLASQVLVVTCDLRNFAIPGERYQGWIDGGMFSMSVLYALHSLGLGACPLNWSVTAGRDRAMRQRAGIPDDELVIMMIAVGHLPDQFYVPASLRQSDNNILIRH